MWDRIGGKVFASRIILDFPQTSVIPMIFFKSQLNLA